MSDSSVFTSYLIKLAKENLAKLIMYIVLAVLGIAFLKWLIFGGFGLLFSGFFKLIGLGGPDDKDVIRKQEVAITQFEQANTTNTTTIAVLQQSNENTQDALQKSYEADAKAAKEYNEIRNKGQEAFNKATKGSKPKKVRDSGSKDPQTPSEAPDEPDPLDSAQSPESMELAAAQYTMLSEAYCKASPGSCSP